ncbi:hypothetical protein CROQUDRAFT_720633 [Cronartium quercuum f. sp. fusiforme G11]|uniref:Uncharacterized protein n=1 Tax=Cronartium quercuum f. sp. fusiforme G11 TaxID=708437 RepID=A0A9P6TF74_9BASI|nr:hypothetical protein CROQUDRAFT_720633 [Cronartium quercuum f. sp. fusiforme G11]
MSAKASEIALINSQTVEPVLILTSGYIFTSFVNFYRQRKNQKRSSYVMAWIVVLLHLVQVICEVVVGWQTMTAAVEGQTVETTALALIISGMTITSNCLIQTHFSSLVYYLMIERRKCWLVLATYLTVTMILFGILSELLLIITRAGFDPGIPLRDKNPTIRHLSLFSTLAYFSNNMLYDAILCFMLTSKLIQSGRLSLGKQMKMIIHSLLCLTLRTFFLTTIVVTGLAIVTLSGLLPAHPNPKLAKQIPTIWQCLASFSSRVYILSFFSSFLDRPRNLDKPQPSPQFLVPFNVMTTRFTEEAGNCIL